MTNLPVVTATKELNAALILASGQFFFGQGIGKPGKITGELCFNTSITGYQEILTDPSYTGQIITFAMPHIGNVGTNLDDNESEQKFANGLVIRDRITNDSNFRSNLHFNKWLEKNGLTGISGVDTRAITSLLRNKGSVNAIILHAKEGEELNIENLLAEAQDVPSLKGMEISSQVSADSTQNWDKISYDYLAPKPQAQDTHIVVVDYGVKNNILNCLVEVGAKISVVNCRTKAEDILALNPDGIFLSNGPGDPDANAIYAVPEIKKLIDKKIPIFGICMGHQLLSLAAGLKTYKMHQGHRGVNHPVKNLLNGKVEITTQNHGFCVSNDDLPANINITHKSLFDDTVEGIEFTDRPAFSVQYHPESSGGPHDSKYLFGQFITMIKANNQEVNYA